MTDYVIGCDNIDGKERSYQSKIENVLKDKGHNTEVLGVGPNHTQSKGLQSSSKGKTAIFIVGGSDIGTYVDFRDGIKKGYYHYKYIWFAFASWTATTWITCKELKSRALVRAHDDNFSSSGSISKYIGKSADDFFKDNKDVMNYVCGQTPEELANKILSGDGGGSSEESKKSSGSSIKEALQKLLTHWDGEVECYIRGDEVHVNKIREPSKYYSCVIKEGVNVFSDSISLTDVNSDTINVLEVEWTGGVITFSDEVQIKRFGENKQTITATKKEEKIEKKTDSDSDEDSGEEVEEETPKTVYTDVPIDNYEDAMKFAEVEWNKLQRDNGRTLECQVIGSTNWKNGEWCKVELPSFEINNFMYITRTSQSLDSGDWTCSLSLVDYPPGWGAEEVEEDTATDIDLDNGDDETETTDETTE